MDRNVCRCPVRSVGHAHRPFIAVDEPGQLSDLSRSQGSFHIEGKRGRRPPPSRLRRAWPALPGLNGLQYFQILITSQCRVCTSTLYMNVYICCPITLLRFCVKYILLSQSHVHLLTTELCSCIFPHYI